MRIIVVDDEPRQRRGIANIIKNLRPDCEVLDFSSGIEVKEYLKYKKVDIIVTDISMPEMNGLELLANLVQDRRKIKVIIISGYAYFEYAQQALKLGVYGYLLKPVDPSKISELLDSLDEQIKDEKEKETDRSKLVQKLNITLPVYIEKQLNKWISGSLNEHELNEIISIFPYQGSGVVIVSRFSELELLLRDYSYNEFDEIRRSVMHWIKDALQPLGHSISFFHESSKNTMVTIFMKRAQDKLCFEQYSSRLYVFINEMNASYGFRVAIGVGSENTDIISNVALSFENAMLALKYKFFFENENIIFYSNISGKSFSVINIKNHEEEVLIENVRKLDKEKSVVTLDRIFERIYGKYTPEPSILIEAMINLILNVIKQIPAVFLEEDFNSFVITTRKTLLESENYMDITLKVKEIITGVIDKLALNKKIRQNNIEDRYIRYLEQHYMGNITLDSVAAVFNLNPSYFSNLIKTLTGSTFSQMLLKVRLEKAKYLLREDDLKISQVSSMVGYSDACYFDRVFKREFGYTPEEYRRLVMER